MCKICPKCGAIAEDNAYYGRITCTSCSWESEGKTNADKNRITYTIKSKKDLFTKTRPLVKTNV